MTMSFHSHAEKTHFHMKGFARGLALKKRHKTIRKWPITCRLYDVMHYNRYWCVRMLYPVMLSGNQGVCISHPVTDHWV